jgi:hypothetical protein
MFDPNACPPGLRETHAGELQVPLIRVDFDCPKCGAHCSGELAVPYPDFTAERSRDMGVDETHEWRCETCEEDFEVETLSEVYGTSARLLDCDNPVSVEDLQEEEPPDDYVPPHDVHAEFAESQIELQQLLWATTDPFVAGTLPPPPAALVRMVFSQLVAVLEAYLADRLHREAIDSPKVKLRLLRGANVLKEQSITLHEAIADPGLADRRFAETIKSVLYHDFEKVEKLYKIAFRTSKVFPSDDNRRELEAAVRLRHHCVHRNGKDKDGNLQAISAKEVETIAKAMRELVEHIERAIEHCRAMDADTEVPPTSGQPRVLRRENEQPIPHHGDPPVGRYADRFRDSGLQQLLAPLI